ncbi:MAG: hypothetical protein J6M39_05270 [Lachnospiraceae bacterium]|nr:hypothetical protein [Lachnospiraceae bacterium]
MKRVCKILALVLTVIISTHILSFAASPWLGDDYPQVYDLYWNNKTAKWYVDGRAHKYEIRLYRDGRRVSTKTVTSRSHNYSSEMSRGDHDYYFEVRPYNNTTGWGEWEQSDIKYVEHYSGGGSTYPSSGPGESYPSSTYPATAQIIYNPVGQWQALNNYWHFIYSNGVMASNTWLLINNKWYYVDINTNMVVGLVNISGSTYYFNPDGTMVTGGIIINGMNHYFDANGKMVY